MTINKSHKRMIDDTSRVVVSYGGAGSGKSVSVAQKILLRIISEENHRIMVTRKVARTLRVSVFQLFKDLISELNMLGDFSINKTDMTITYIPNNSSILFFGMDDVERLKSVQGITSIWLEESSEMIENDFAELNRRLRGETPYYKQIILTFNPISHLHWLKARFFDNTSSSASIYKSTYKDNKFIDDEYKYELEDIKNYDTQQYNVYVLAEWGVLNTNIVYHNFKYKKHTTSLTVKDFDVLHVGIDFNIGGCVGVVCGISDSKAYVLDGFAVYDTAAVVSKLMSYRDKTIITYPDASGGARSTNSSKSDLQIIRDGGFTVNAPKGNGAIRDRVNACNRMFAMDNILINDRVEKLMHSLQIQAYKENGDPEKWTEHKGGAVDDWNDALGYFIVRKFGLVRSGVKQVDLTFA